MGYEHGLVGLTKDMTRAADLYTEAKKLGSLDAHYHLGYMYYVDGKDLDKALHHYETAAKGGHPLARYNLGCLEAGQGRIDRSLKHLMISATMGHGQSLSLNVIKKMYVFNGVAWVPRLEQCNE